MGKLIEFPVQTSRLQIETLRAALRALDKRLEDPTLDAADRTRIDAVAAEIELGWLAQTTR